MQYSIPRRIWRIIYPPLIYVSLSLVIALLAGIAIGIYAGLRVAMSEATAISQAELTKELTQMVRDNAHLITLISGLAGLAVFLPMWLKTQKQIDKYKNGSVSVTALLIAGMFAGLNLLLICAMAMTDILKLFPSYESVSESLTRGSVLFQILAIGIAAPVVEELCFRGILINRMRWLPVWAAVFVQGALFALAHMNLFQGIYAFIVGILLGLIYLRFRSVTLTIIGHMAFNLASTLINASTVNARVPVMAVLIPAATITAICIFLLCNRPKAALIEEGDAAIL